MPKVLQVLRNSNSTDQRDGVIDLTVSPFPSPSPPESALVVKEEVIDPVLQVYNKGKARETMPLPFPVSPLSPLPNSIAVNISEPREDIINGRNDCDTNEAIDPNTICPFCDRKLPENPSVTLKEMRAELETKTWLSPTIDNPYHRNAVSFRDFIGHCTRHRFETEQLPAAAANGWPMSPDFSTIFDRVCREYISLAAIVEGGANEFLTMAKEYYIKYRGQVGHQIADGRFLKSGAG